MNYGEVALGVECALPARYEAWVRRGRSTSPLFWLVLVLATLAML